MKRITKRVFTSVITYFMVCIMFVTPVLAASSSFSKGTTKLNALNGGKSTVSTFSSGSVLGADPSVTQIKLALNVSRGTDPYTLYIKSPEGTVVSMTGKTSSTTIYIHDFDGENPSGTWSSWIVNSGVSYNGNIIPASTVTVSATVYYSY